MTASSIQALVTGRGGRMSDQVVQAIEETAGIGVAQVIGEGEGVESFDSTADVLIDFTAPGAVVELASFCAQNEVALVTGTTGLDESHLQALRDASEHVAVLAAPNMSVGVNLLCDLVGRATTALGPAADIEIVETHHRHKVDAPSGTAMRLAEVITDARSVSIDDVGRFARHGLIGARPDGEVGIQTLRGGDVVGEHTVYLLLDGERIELTHRATDRTIFARGAVRAALWIAGRDSGLYTMADVLSG